MSSVADISTVLSTSSAEAPLVHAPTHEEAVARLHYLVDNRRPLGLLLGSANNSREAVLRAFAREVTSAHTSMVRPTGWNHYELLWNLAEIMGTRPPAQESKSLLWRRIEDRLAENHYQQLCTIVLCNDATAVEFSANEIWQNLLHIAATTGLSLVLVLGLCDTCVPWLGNDLLELCDLKVEIF